MKKIEENKTFKGICTDLSHEGLGVVKDNNKPYFVNDLLPEEEAEIEVTNENKNYGFGKIIQRLTTSDKRITPKCKYYGSCGGCDLAHMSYEEEVKFKLKMVNETLKRIGHLDYQIQTIVPADNIEGYRNKVQIPFKNLVKKNKCICGFYQKKSHNIIEVRDCLLQTNLTTEIMIFVKNMANELRISAYDEVSHKGVIRHLLVRNTVNNDYMVCYIVNDFNKGIESNLVYLTEKLVNKYPQVKSVIININNNNNNIILGNDSKTIFGKDYLIEDILGLKFKLSHKAFFQINHEQTEKLYTKAIEFAKISNNDVILDSYCGVGTICLLASQYAKKAYGIEIIPEAIDNARENAKINKIDNAFFYIGATEDIIKDIPEKIDVLFVDPPRKGLDISVVNFLIESKIKRIVYVSCDIATMSRDLNLLTNSYIIKDGCSFDLFPRTANVECVVCLERR